MKKLVLAVAAVLFLTSAAGAQCSGGSCTVGVGVFRGAIFQGGRQPILGRFRQAHHEAAADRHLSIAHRIAGRRARRSGGGCSAAVVVQVQSAPAVQIPAPKLMPKK